MYEPASGKITPREISCSFPIEREIDKGTSALALRDAAGALMAKLAGEDLR
jgi:hypothetical protein